MHWLALVIEFVLHVDVHLSAFVLQYGAWVYALLFAIVFIETGVVVMPFLPGDSLLFVTGTMCAAGLMSLPLVLGLLWAAAVLGNQSNYAIGRRIGPRAFQWETSTWFNRAAFDQAHAFYERHGGVTIVAARFMPFLRTFAPFVAGVAQMTHRRFTWFDVIGGALWIGSVTLAGYLFGNIPWVAHNLEKIIWQRSSFPGCWCSPRRCGHGRSRRGGRPDAGRGHTVARHGRGARPGRSAGLGDCARRCALHWCRCRLCIDRTGGLLVDGPAADDALVHLRKCDGVAMADPQRGRRDRQQRRSDRPHRHALIASGGRRAGRAGRRRSRASSAASGRACSCRVPGS